MKGTEFAQQLHRQRQSIYHLFKQESIDTLLLKKISEVLKHDFFLDYSESLTLKTNEPDSENGRSMDRLSRSIDRLSEEVKLLAQSQQKTRS
jgi:hypothetical protein